MVKLIMLSTVPKLMAILHINFIADDVSNFFRSLIREAMAIRNKENIYRPDLINILMQVRKGKSVNQSANEESQSNDGFATTEEYSINKTVTKRTWTDDELYVSYSSLLALRPVRVFWHF